jgi:hypothetical protein
MSAQQPRGERWGEILGLVGLFLGCATYLAEQPPIVLGLALTLDSAASFGGVLWFIFSWRPKVGIIAMSVFLAVSVGFYWWRASSLVLVFPTWPIPHLPPGVVPTIRR